ncbi:hypothetical protein D3C87_411650 [compost metagenome]
MNSVFELRIIDLHWINDECAVSDLCAHGHVYLKIGNEIVCDKETLDVTVSATALYLMRTLSSNYKEGDYDNQLLPCCGHFYFSTAVDEVYIGGCPSGIDWTIEHLDGNVKHTTKNNEICSVAFEDYKTAVLAFADIVAGFYNDSEPKELPIDEFDARGYEAFWNEWNNLRNKWA